MGKKQTALVEYGIAFGRFQPFHIGHLEYVKKVWEKCTKLIVGITNPDPSLMKFVPEDNKRDSLRHNPFSYWDRKQLISEALLSYGIPLDSFEIVPFPINYPEYIKFYIPEKSNVYIIILEEWGYAKIKLLKKAGLNIEQIFLDYTEKNVEGIKIRNKIVSGEDYKHDIPESVYRKMKSLKLDEKLIQVYKSSSDH